MVLIMEIFFIKSGIVPFTDFSSSLLPHNSSPNSRRLKRAVPKECGRLKNLCVCSITTVWGSVSVWGLGLVDHSEPLHSRALYALDLRGCRRWNILSVVSRGSAWHMQMGSSVGVRGQLKISGKCACLLEVEGKNL